MPHNPLTLRSQDVAVAFRLAVDPGGTYLNLGRDLSISSSTAHESVERLQLAGLLRPESRQVNRRALLEFLEHGLRYVFPARPGSKVRGVPTAWSGPPLANEIVAEDVIVWPDPHGARIGQWIAPLLEHAADLSTKHPQVYELLTLADAIRIGRVRERVKAVTKLKERLLFAA